MAAFHLGKTLAYLLRHGAKKEGLVIDDQGWVSTDELLTWLSPYSVTFELLDLCVQADDKGRYSFNEDMSKLRANQGHSLKNIKMDYEEKVPPNLLYHGTVNKAVDSIMKSGLKKMSRHHVHMTSSLDTAQAVGKRRGTPVILKIDTVTMIADGFKFYMSENNVWLTDNVPAKYLTVV